LEDGLEDARRGEAEARGEVEFLRGEVERGRSELRREREKGSSGPVENGGSGNEMDGKLELEMKEDEIRGLKAIIHSLQAGRSSSPPKRRASSAYSDEKGLSRQRIGHELEAGRDGMDAKWCEACETEGHDILSCRIFARGGGHNVDGADEEEAEGDEAEDESAYDDTAGSHAIDGKKHTDGAMKAQNAHSNGVVAVEQDKWCALCEQDGHLAFDCPNEQY